jgi:hypothetical protein
MHKPFLFIPVLLFGLNTWAQELSQVIFSGGTTLSSFSFITDQKVVIRISEDGRLLEWGTDPGTGRYNYYTGRLQPYLGRVDNYAQSEYDSVLRGKVKSIGTCVLKYYGAADEKSKAGKLKSIGGVSLDYFANYENTLNKGKLKSAGYNILDYYSASENEALRSKLKSVGNTQITYYSTFDDKMIKGKIKSIGTFSYSWYTSNDRKEFQGALKSGPTSQNINGVTYLLR